MTDGCRSGYGFGVRLGSVNSHDQSRVMAAYTITFWV